MTRPAGFKTATYSITVSSITLIGVERLVIQALAFGDFRHIFTGSCLLHPFFSKLPRLVDASS